MSGGRACCGVLVGLLAGALAMAGWTVGIASATQHPIRPVLGDWEGKGPLGLRLSFAFVRGTGGLRVADLALGLPTGCRSAGTETWAAGAVSKVEYIAPGTVLHGPFPPMGPRQFELILPPTRQQPLPAPFEGTFSSSRRGTLLIESPTRYGCRHTGWPRTLRFTLSAAHRVPVADGLWTGTVNAPAGMTGTVKIRVIDHGRIETDFLASYTCPAPTGGGGTFEIGPLPSTGYLIAANGAIGQTKGTQMAWSGRFARTGAISGRFIALGCSSGPEASFTARRTGA